MGQSAGRRQGLDGEGCQGGSRLGQRARSEDLREELRRQMEKEISERKVVP